MIEVGVLPVLFFGFLLGVKHALDADHVVAVSTIVSEHKNLIRSSLIGVSWGLGHTIMLFLAGLFVLAFKLTIPNTLALSLEFVVGAVLVILGISIAKGIISDKMHFHHHAHGKRAHFHFHSHRGNKTHRHEHKSFIVGMVHGLAGSAALMLLVLTTVDSMYQGLLYILIFGIGSIIAMLVISTLIGLPFVFTASRFEEINEKIKLTAGLISILLGIFIMVEIGFIEGLFF